MWTSRHRTLDEWLDQPPFTLTQCFVSLFGALFIVVIASHAWDLLYQGWEHLVVERDDENSEIHSRTDCFAPAPISIPARLLVTALGVLPVWGMWVVWRRPRMGFFLSGIGLALNIVAFRVLALLMEGLDNAMEKCFNPTWDTFFLMVLLWLAFAWWKVGPDRQLARKNIWGDSPDPVVLTCGSGIEDGGRTHDHHRHRPSAARAGPGKTQDRDIGL